ncbi:cytochrome bd oxidase small subunit CydS [Evansella tamaricis]|uniref:ATP synthase F0 subunit 8 n=1 Tax=Evansella tamaricis TaxID=2069301 RepID=A0ABS6JLN9_9BACI|nr:hypothetical protein [Evansella tamaricis]MBU9714601.1 hypothetical protein [Evansella tamaricis]
MNLTWFLIMIAPLLVLVACIALVFLWATYGKTPAFIAEETDGEGDNQNRKLVND